MCRLSWNLGAIASWPSGPVQGLCYLYLYHTLRCDWYWNYRMPYWPLFARKLHVTGECRKASLTRRALFFCAAIGGRNLALYSGYTVYKLKSWRRRLMTRKWGRLQCQILFCTYRVQIFLKMMCFGTYYDCYYNAALISSTVLPKSFIFTNGCTMYLLRSMLNFFYLESFEMWCWRRMENISWTDHMRNEDVLLRVNQQRNILHEIRKRKANWISHILRRNCLLKQVIEGKIKGEM